MTENMTDFERMVNEEILLWSLQNSEKIKHCNGKQDVAEAFWADRIAPLYSLGGSFLI